MKEITNEIILEAVARFRNGLVTQDAVNEFCTLRGVQPMTLGELDDHIYQVKHDERMVKLYPLILAEIAKIKYYSDYATKAETAQRNKDLDEIEDRIVEVLTEQEIPYRLIDSTINELKGIVEKMLGVSKTRVSNLCVGVMLKVTEKHFGDKEFTVGQAQGYYKTIKEEIAEAK